MFKLVGKMVVVIGFGCWKGIGEVLIMCFVEEGCNVVIFDLG